MVKSLPVCITAYHQVTSQKQNKFPNIPPRFCAISFSHSKQWYIILFSSTYNDISAYKYFSLKKTSTLYEDRQVYYINIRFVSLKSNKMSLQLLLSLQPELTHYLTDIYVSLLLYASYLNKYVVSC